MNKSKVLGIFDLYKTTSQMASSILILEKEKVERGEFYLEIVDKREKFVMV